MALIPKTAISEQGQLNGVFIVDDRQTAHFRLVRTGKIYGDQVEVLSGLNDGQRYVQVIPPTMQDGAKVENNG